MFRVEHDHRPDAETVKAARGLIDDIAAQQGHAPIGEAKQAELDRGGDDWSAILAYEGDDLIGYVHLHWNRDARKPRAVVELATRDAVAGALLEEARKAVAAAGGGLLWSWAHGVKDPTATDQARAGFHVQRRLAVMQRRLQEPVPPVDLRDGLVIRSYRAGRDDQELLRVNNAAFAGHPEQGGWTPADLQARLERYWFDPADLLMAWRGDELCGFHWTKRHPEEPGLGEVYVLGIDPDAQGLGLGRSLLRAGMRHLADRGCERVVLYVDTGEEAAIRLYESEGFSTLYEEVCYELSVSPGSSL